MRLPEGIDPQTPVGELTAEQLRSLAASVVASRRWEKATKKDRAAQGHMLAQKRRRMTKAQRTEIARNAGLASAAARAAARTEKETGG